MSVIAYDRLAVTEEVLRLAVPYRKHVVIEIQIFLIQTRNPVQMHLYRIAVECRQELCRYDVLVKNDLEIFTIGPLRDLRRVRNHKIYIPDERHPAFYAPEQIFESSPVAEPLLHHRNIRRLLIILLPHRIISVHICNHRIHKRCYSPNISFIYNG